LRSQPALGARLAKSTQLAGESASVVPIMLIAPIVPSEY
jgi:hypothetical protein